MTQGPIQARCNECGRDTYHDVLYREPEQHSEPIDGYSNLSIEWGIDHSLIRCGGCKTVSLRQDSWCSEDVDEMGRYNLSSRFFPPRTFRLKPKWFTEAAFLASCPDGVVELFEEACICLQNSCHRSAAMAVRALLEGIFIATVGDKGTFQDKLSAFAEARRISEPERLLIDTALEAGHASMHRDYCPSQDELMMIVDIAENVLKLMYYQQSKVEELRLKIPPKIKPA